MLTCINFILWMIERLDKQTDQFLYRKWFYKNVCLRCVAIHTKKNKYILILRNEKHLYMSVGE